MPTTELKRRRGTAAQVDAMTPVVGEIVVDTTNNRMCLGNGTTLGGKKFGNASDMQKQVFTSVTSGGTANAITLTYAPAVESYSSGLALKFKASLTNTGALTVNVNGLGVINILKLSGTTLIACVGGEVIAGVFYEISHDGTQFQLSSSVGSSGGSNIQAFTGSGTWTKPTGFSPDATVLMEVIGGGGAGGNSSTTGAVGGDTSIATWIVGYGGGGGTSAGVGGAGGKGAGQHGSTGGANNANGGSAGHSGGGGGGSGTGVGGTGVTGALGGAGGNAGSAGSTYGGGGGGDSTGGGGGGGGGYSFRWARLGDVGATETVTVGAGGSGGVRSGAAGYVRITVIS